jgi:glycosyltransferase involved in cell wall biosynthesis
MCIEVYQEQVAKYSKDVIYVGNFISDAFHKCDADNPSKRKKIILTIARPGYNKGFDIFVKAICELLKIRRDFEFHVVNANDSPVPIHLNM